MVKHYTLNPQPHTPNPTMLKPQTLDSKPRPCTPEILAGEEGRPLSYLPLVLAALGFRGAELEVWGFFGIFGQKPNL